MRTFLSLLTLLAAAAPAQEKPAIAAFSFLSGCWAGEASGEHFEETWMKPAGGTLLGVSRTIAQGKTVFTEYMQIATNKDGVPVYIVQLRLAAKTTTFTLSKHTPGEVTFSHPEHDFPQRIIYKKTADGLFARIEGTENGVAKAQNFPMRAVACK